MAAVLVTGSEGYIGASLIPFLSADFDLVTVDRRPARAPGNRLAHIEADMGLQPTAVTDAIAREEVEVTAVLHLAAIPHTSLAWEALYQDNVLATVQTYRLARELGVQKVLFASSVHVVDGHARHPERWPVRLDDEAWPTNAYGVGKLVGESFLRMLSDEVSTIRGYALRIGAYWDARGPLHSYPRADLLFLHAEDFAQIVLLCLREPRAGGFAKLFCTSRVRTPVLDISETQRLLGYEPRHDAADFFQEMKR